MSELLDLLFLVVVFRSRETLGGQKEPVIYKRFWLYLDLAVLMASVLVLLCLVVLTFFDMQTQNVHDVLNAHQIGEAGKALFAGAALSGTTTALSNNRETWFFVCIALYACLVVGRQWPSVLSGVPSAGMLCIATLFFILSAYFWLRRYQWLKSALKNLRSE